MTRSTRIGLALVAVLAIAACSGGAGPKPIDETDRFVFGAGVAGGDVSR